jgi:hypothetical protein
LTLIESKGNKETPNWLKAVGFLSSFSNQQDNIKDDEELTVFCKQVFKNNQRREGWERRSRYSGRRHTFYTD